MSYIPSSKMKHAHVETAHPSEPPAAPASRLSVPLWSSIAAGVAGAVGAAVLLSLRSSTPKPKKGRGGRKGAKRKPADD